MIIVKITKGNYSGLKKIKVKCVHLHVKFLVQNFILYGSSTGTCFKFVYIGFVITKKNYYAVFLNNK